MDLMVDTTSANAVKLKHIFDVYGLDQLNHRADENYPKFSLFN